MPIKEKCFKFDCDREATHVCIRELPLEDDIEIYTCESHMELFMKFGNELWKIKKIEEKDKT